MFSCYRIYVRAILSRSNLGPGLPQSLLSLLPLLPPRDRKTQGTRRRNFSIRFPSGALINCGQFLKRRNEGTAAMHSSRAFLIGSRARRIFVHRWRDVWFFLCTTCFVQTLAKRDDLIFNNLHVLIIYIIIRELFLWRICNDNERHCNCGLIFCKNVRFEK